MGVWDARGRQGRGRHCNKFRRFTSGRDYVKIREEKR